MTDERMALAELLEKGSDHDLLREMIGFVAQRLMDLDVDGLVGAGHGERAGELRELAQRLPGRAGLSISAAAPFRCGFRSCGAGCRRAIDGAERRVRDPNRYMSLESLATRISENRTIRLPAAPALAVTT